MTAAGVTVGDDPALGENEDAVAKAHDRLHDMLDHENRNSRSANFRDDRYDVAHLGWIEPRQHLVEQQQARLGRERAREFEALAPRDGEPGSGRVEPVGEADELATASARPSASSRRAMAQVRAHGDVLAHAEAGEGAHNLESARNAQRFARTCGAWSVMSSPLKRMRSARRRLETGDQRE